MVGFENHFTPKDLMRYAKSLVKESKTREASVQKYCRNYGWLSSRYTRNDSLCTDEVFDELRALAEKLSSESCAKIAVKLDDLTTEVENTAVIINTFKKLLEYQYTMQMMNDRVYNAKVKGFKKGKMNKVHPMRMPNGQRATVSFILH